VLIDGARIRAGENMAQRAVETACDSVLSMYNSELMKEYGIFALSVDEHEIKTRLEYYINENLGIHKSVNPSEIKLYEFEVESLEVMPLYNLTENTVVENQLLRFMKYRAPLEIGMDFLGKINLFKEMSHAAKVYEKKISLDGLLADIDTLCRNLKENIDGFIGKESLCVNRFNEEERKAACTTIAEYILKRRAVEDTLEIAAGSVENLKQKISGIENDIKNIEGKIRSLGEKIMELSSREETREQVENLLGEIDSEESKKLAAENELAGYRRQLSEAEAEKNRLADEARVIDKSITDAFNNLYYDLTLSFIEPNRKARENIGKILEMKDKVLAAINEIKALMENEPVQDTAGLFAELSEELDILADKVLDSVKGTSLLDSINSNLDYLHRQKSILDTAKRLLDDGQDIPGTRAEILAKLGEGIEGYRKVIYAYETVGGNETGKDSRQKVTQGAKNLLDKINSRFEQVFNDFGKAGINIEKLPSRYKVTTVLPEEYEDSNGVTGNTAGGINDGEEASNHENFLAEIKDEMGFTGNGEFASKGFAFLAGIGGKISSDLENSRDNIYINEYIIRTFSNSLDLSGREEDVKGGFFTSEVEYIMNGSTSEKINRLITNGKILLARFACNTLHVYTDPVKRNHAVSLATAACSWWTGGLGVPLMSNLIMCAWGMGESVLDLKDILEGKAVPFFKLKGDWKLDIGLGSEKDVELSKSGICFDYKDYLRLFLLAVSNDKKISRIEDIIKVNLSEANSEKELYEMHTCIRVEAVISVNYLFPTGKLVYGRTHHAGNRHRYRITLYKGY